MYLTAVFTKGDLAMFKNIRVCFCDICKKPMQNRMIRILLTELNENEMPKASSEYDGTPIDVCDHCMKKLKEFVYNDLAQADPVDNTEYLK